jgi:alpha/beta superfamily hydrolase
MIKDLTVLTVDNINIVGQICLPDTKHKYPLVCLCHGMPSGEPPREGDGGYPELAEKLCQRGMAVFWFNFRGTGESGGNFDIMGWARDLRAVLDHLWSTDSFDKGQMSLAGFSAGAAVAIYVASQDARIYSIVACSCPAEITPVNYNNNWNNLVAHLREIGSIRDEDFPRSIDEWSASFQRISPIKCVDKIAPRPLLIIHGSEDNIVPLENAQELYEEAGLPKSLMIIDGGGHRLRREPKVIDAIYRWTGSGEDVR